MEIGLSAASGESLLEILLLGLSCIKVTIKTEQVVYYHLSDRVIVSLDRLLDNKILISLNNDCLHSRPVQ